MHSKKRTSDFESKLERKIRLLPQAICSFNLKNILLPLFNGFIALIAGILLSGLWPALSIAQIRFEDVSEAAGILHWEDSYGASWGDFNEDNWPDLWVGNHSAKPSLYVNNTDGSFRDVIDLIQDHISIEQHGAAWADYDNDGDKDLLVIAGGAMEKGVYANQFFVNSGGSLDNRAAEYALEYRLGRGRTPLWFDWNSDGYLDVFVTNLDRDDNKMAPSVLFTQHDESFRNDNRLFPETPGSSQLAQIFIQDPSSSAQLVVYGHGSPHTNYHDPYPNKIYTHSSLSFRDVTDTLGNPKAYDVKDIAIADFNNDMRNDFFMVTAIWGGLDIVKPESKNDILLTQSAEGFHDSTAAAGLESLTSCWSVTSADFDNDMDMDLYLVCSGVYCNAPNILYENLGDGTFRSVSRAGGAEGSTFGRGDSVAAADYNNDGFIDLFVTNREDGYKDEIGHNQLFRNVGNTNHWIEVELEGVVSNRDGIGALIVTSVSGTEQMRIQGGGMHRVSQDHQRIHFGMGKNRMVDNLRIQWPSTIIQEMNDIPADQIINVVELDFAGSVTAGASPLTVQFTSDKSGRYKGVKYNWDFDNNGKIDSTVQSPSYTYMTPGVYTVKLIVSDSNGSFTSVRKDYVHVFPGE